VHCNNAAEWVPEVGALFFVLEHRYYGCHNKTACPVSQLDTPEDFRYLSSDQALEDLATFHDFASRKYGLTKHNKWITFGGSYPGMMAGWARVKYPNLFSIAVVSSAPVKAQLNMRGYNDLVARAYGLKASMGQDGLKVQACRHTIAVGHAQIGELLETSDGRAKLEEMFELAKGQLDTAKGRRDFAGNGVVDFPAQSNDPLAGLDWNIDFICSFMMDYSFEPLAGLAKLRHGRMRSVPSNISAPRRVSGIKADTWAWQACTEFGFFQTCEVGSNCMFTQGLVTVETMFEDMCKPFNITDMSNLKRAIERVNQRGSDRTAVSRMLYVNGEVDPWTALAVEQLTSEQRALGNEVFLVRGASHHYWTHPNVMQDVKKRIRAVVSKWLDEIGAPLPSTVELSS